MGCKRHKKIFNDYNVIPNNCFGCYKVIIEPKTVIDLVKLYILFDNIKLESFNSQSKIKNKKKFFKTSDIFEKKIDKIQNSEIKNSLYKLLNAIKNA